MTKNIILIYYIQLVYNGLRGLLFFYYYLRTTTKKNENEQTYTEQALYRGIRLITLFLLIIVPIFSCYAFILWQQWGKLAGKQAGGYVVAGPLYVCILYTYLPVCEWNQHIRVSRITRIFNESGIRGGGGCAVQHASLLRCKYLSRFLFFPATHPPTEQHS